MSAAYGHIIPQAAGASFLWNIQVDHHALIIRFIVGPQTLDYCCGQLAFSVLENVANFMPCLEIISE